LHGRRQGSAGDQLALGLAGGLYPKIETALLEVDEQADTMAGARGIGQIDETSGRDRRTRSGARR
jgi:hypothetical protein